MYQKYLIYIYIGKSNAHVRFSTYDLSMSKLHRTLNPKYIYNISDTELSVILTFNIHICRQFPTRNIFLL